VSISSYSSSAELLQAVASEFEAVILKVLESKPKARVLLTGGTLGIELVKELGKLDLPWHKVWLMFSDERFVSGDDPDRNELQATSVWPELSKNLTRYPESDQDLDSAAEHLEALLIAELGPVSGVDSVFDISILGMGPDAHVASLFPGHDRSGGWVIAESESPKPPQTRLSLSYKALNRAERVWFLASGASKVWAVKQSLRADSGLPAAMVRGVSETRWFLDQEITDEL
jgi:6-phosphogluconolactonase